MPKIIDDERVFRAAIQAVIERGFARATTKQIAEAAGISEVTLFRKYESKSEVVKQAIFATAVQMDFTAASDYTGDVAADLQRVVAAYQALSAQHGQFITTLMGEIARHPELGDLLDDYSIYLATLLDCPQPAVVGARLAQRLSEAGIPVTVLVAPIIPVINDAEIERIVETVAEAGARGAGYVLLRLPLEINRLFQDWLQTHYPLKAGHVMARVRDMRGGREYESGFGTRMRGRGLFADLIATRFAGALRRAGLDGERPVLDTSQFRPPSPRAATGETQIDLF